MNTFYADKPTGKFVAFWDDGSGASLFWRLDDINGLPAYCDCNGDDIQGEEAETFFEGNGYIYWLSLPDSFKFWFELTP